MLITPGLLTALALIILIMKLRSDTIKKLLGFDIYLDLLATAIMLWAFAGTYAGMMAGIIGGLTFSIVLILLKRTLGYKKLKYVHTEDHLVPTLQWLEVKPFWRRKDPELDAILSTYEKEAKS